MATLQAKICNLLGFDPNRHNWKTEVLAGITSFLTMSYILAVNPSMFGILEGMPQGAVFTTTALVALISTLLVAFVARMPFGIAPGMGPNAFFVFTVCISMKYSWQFAVTAILIEGFILLVLTLTKLREAIVDIIPNTIKKSLTIGIGLFIAFVGLQNAGIIIKNDSTLVTFGSITQGSGLLTIIGLIITALFVVKNIKGGMLWAILITTIIGIPMGLTKYQGLISLPHSPAPIFCQFEFDKVLTIDMLVIVLSFLCIDLFSLTGSAIGVCMKGGFADKDGRIAGINRLFIADSLGTITSSLLGTSAACTFIESSTGAVQGGKTGLTALATALCFGVALILSPIFLAIPAAATAPILIILGLMMFKSVTELDLEDMSEAIPGFITIILMPLAYSIADGILIGIISYVVINTICGNFKKLSPGMYILALLFILKYIFL
ncbi:NCS2 family permease [Methanobrevibacter sp.]|jgi:AGZA family xanthine/uracil permease-like MFS transporter|uniref:NCS2 family permease n=1 Tax=Methanobrevibacter sp. TaxID=66852 RepID=UPI002E7AA998|nr:NCS2 family permease [Methanobrevibacter sp.]MEE0236296.1 NCS2 family permease [Bacteroidales bacterium]MEE1335957.1 NCS2 family permease [Methanobrevibacter sp.]